MLSFLPGTDTLRNPDWFCCRELDLSFPPDVLTESKLLYGKNNE
jgi:hypothetical protein